MACSLRCVAVSVGNDGRNAISIAGRIMQHAYIINMFRRADDGDVARAGMSHRVADNAVSVMAESMENARSVCIYYCSLSRDCFTRSIMSEISLSEISSSLIRALTRLEKELLKYFDRMSFKFDFP